MSRTYHRMGYRTTRRNHVIRRIIHLGSGSVVLFYLFPGQFLYLPMKLWLIILFGIIPLFIEIIRLKKGWLLPGQREHEKETLGSYAWALWASMAIMLVLPQVIALPVIIIYTLADPIIGEIRSWKKWLVVPIGLTFTTFLFIVFGYHPVLGVYAGGFMLIGEALEIVGTLRLRPELYKLYRNSNFSDNFLLPFKTDDNASTQLVPALALGLVYIFHTAWFPEPWLSPLL